ncbi:MAG: hypothetical protein U9N44_06065, partial [Chloroflexota bacterium]|nr:hypothetical protein [Chloroflexota bacterium]
IADNDINGLKNNGVNIKTEEMGLAFENVTKAVLRRLGMNVSDDLRKEINTKTNRTDIIIDLGDSNIIIVECKSSRKDYSKFSSVTRQLKAYVNHCEKHGYKVKGAILISGSFTDDFIQECKTFYEFNVTLIDAQTFINIYEEFKQSKLKGFPVTLFRHGLIQEEIISKALKK